MQWKKTTGWALTVVALLLAIGVTIGYFYLRSNGFQQYALRRIEEAANQATGGRTQIGSLDFSLSTLTAHLHNVVVRGTERPGDPPLLQVDELTVELKIQSVFRRKFSLSALLIEHPVMHFQVDRRGKNNLPQAPPSDSSSQTDIFDLAVGHFALNHGEVNYNDKKIPLNADLYDLKTDIRFDSLATRYRGTISYNNGHLQYAGYAPLPHSLHTQFSATRSLFSLESAVMKIGASTASLRADITNYAEPTATGDYDIHIHAQDFSVLSPDVKPGGDISLFGKLDYRNKANQSFLQSVALTGQLASEELSAVTSNGRLELRRLAGTYHLANGTLRAAEIKAGTLGGELRAAVEVKDLDTTPSSHINALLHSISLHAVQQAVHGAELKQVAVLGSVDGKVDASWTGSPSNIRARSDLTIRAEAKNAASTANIPVDGAIHMIYDGPRNTLTVRQSTLHIPSTTLTADGEVSKRSSLVIHAQADDLHQLVKVASAFTSRTSPPPVIAGSAKLDATVRGSMQNPQISGQLAARDLRVQGSEWKSAQLSVAANPSQLVVSHGALVNAKRGRASFDATIALRNWSYLPGNSIHANLSAQQVSVTDLQRLANVQYPISGDLSANLSVKGSQLNPAGSGSINLVNGRAYDEPIQTLGLKFEASNGSITSTLHAASPAGDAKASLTYTPRTKAYKLSLDAPAIVLQKLHRLQETNKDVKGTLSASASGEGTLDDPRLAATIQLPKLEMRQGSIAGLKVETNIANKHAAFTLDSQVEQASVRARGDVDLTGDYEAAASIDTSAIPLEVLLASFSSSVPEGFQGQTELHATLKGPLKDKTRLEAHITIPTLTASYQQLQIGAAAPIRADYAHSVVTIEPAEIRGTGTSLRVQGSIPLTGSSAPNLTAKGTVDVRILGMLRPDLKSSGTVALDLHASGSPQSPSVQGQVKMQNVSLLTADAPIGVEKLNGILDVSNDRLQISSMTGEVGGGQVSVGGFVVYRPSPQFNLALQGSSVRLRYPQGLRTVLDGNLTLSGTLQASSLNGQVLIDSLSFTPDFDLASFSDQFSSNAATPVQPGFADTIQLAIGVQSKANLSARSSQVSLEGNVRLRASGTAAHPVVTGRTDLTSGELFYRNNRYQLQRGIITFNDPNQINPNLDVSVKTQVEQYNLTITLRGQFDRLTTSYVSDPPLATADIINLVAFGKTTSESASSGSQSTDSMIASGAQSAIGSGVSSGIQKLAGLSSLQINPLLGGSSQNPSAQIALQQRVTRNFLFTFSTDVSQPGNEMVQGEYQINKRWSVSVTRDQVGGVSVDGRLHTKF